MLAATSISPPPPEMKLKGVKFSNFDINLCTLIFTVYTVANVLLLVESTYY